MWFGRAGKFKINTEKSVLLLLKSVNITSLQMICSGRVWLYAPVVLVAKPEAREWLEFRINKPHLISTNQGSLLWFGLIACGGQLLELVLRLQRVKLNLQKCFVKGWLQELIVCLRCLLSGLWSFSKKNNLYSPLRKWWNMLKSSVGQHKLIFLFLRSILWFA